MNEPALFYSPERLKAFFESMDELSRKDNIVQDEFFGKVVGGALGLMNAPEDYASFYHDVDGQRVRHDRVHNLYGGNMTRAAGEAFAACGPADARCSTAVPASSAATATAASGWVTTLPHGHSFWPISR